ncbi:MAG: hypothetical protein DI551_06330 [Micavibrio aeruginosavorus]|uniref:Acyltransferase n=1 Tax=Micavibrio aeruginosavorus TaxID=349221 RepID=A0A2W5N0B7_9BACT|nr:MAG: hypothetical protein DI551_06330 [Micavibrio aeruginosavorus]
MKYKSEIDGLRAVAVMSVILYHFGIPYFSGGFIGVDIFFVISGYLITSIIKEDLELSRFSFLKFYERRIRRILPALIIVSFVAAIISCIIFLPNDLEDIGASLVASMASISNIYFWRNTGYFSTAAEEKPFLHTWSLGVEEQFYLLFPLFIFWMWKFFPRKALLPTMIVVGIVSISLAEFLLAERPPMSFFLLPSRAWELLLGSSLSFFNGHFSPKKSSANASSLIGIILISIAVLGYSNSTKFPGVHALLPCLGAALIIISPFGQSFIGKILSTRIFVFTGKISYSLYLWHWPLLAMLRYRYGDNISYSNYALAFLATFLLSIATWRFIETPFRNPAFLTQKKIFILATAFVLLLSGTGGFLYFSKGWPQRYDAQTLALENSSKRINPLRKKCHSQEGFTQNKGNDCMIGDLSSPEISVIIWGDSHADSMSPAISKILSERRIKGIQATKSSCPPLPDDYEWKTRNYESCKIFNKDVLDFILNTPSIGYVVLHARWGGPEKTITHSGIRTEQTFYEALKEIAETIQKSGRKVYFIAPTPLAAFNVPRCLSRRQAFNDTDSFPCEPKPKALALAEPQEAINVFKKISKKYPVYFPDSILCKGERCLVADGKTPVYYDDDHISLDGIELFIPTMRQKFRF